LLSTLEKRLLVKRTTLPTFSYASLSWIFGFDVFISYARSDGSPFSEALRAALSDAKLRVFLDSTELPDGTNLPLYLTTAIRRSSVVAIVCTPGAFKSSWILREAEIATRLGKLIVPLIAGPELSSVESSTELGRILLNCTWISDVGILDSTPRADTLVRLRRSSGFMRRSRRITAAYGAAALVFGAVAALSFWLYLRAETNRLLATSRQLAALAESALGDEYDLGTLLAVTSDRTVSTRQSKNALLRAATAPLSVERYLRGHESHVSALGANTHAALMASGDRSGVIQLWDFYGKPLRRVQGRPGASVVDLDVSADGVVAAAFSSSEIWLLDSHQLLERLNPPVQDVVTHLAWSGRTLIALYGGSGLFSWIARDGRWQIREVTSIIEPVGSFAASKDGGTVAVAVGSIHEVPTIKIFSRQAGGDFKQRTLFSPPGFEDKRNHRGVTALALSHDGRLLALPGFDEVVQLYDLDKAIAGPVAYCQANRVGVTDLEFSSDAARVYSSSVDGSLRVARWDGRSCDLFMQQTANRRGLLALEVVARKTVEAEVVFAASGDGSIVTWNLEQESPLGTRAMFTPGFPFDLSVASGRIYLSTNDGHSVFGQLVEFEVGAGSLRLINLRPTPGQAVGAVTAADSEDLVVLAGNGLLKFAKDRLSDAPTPILNLPDPAFWKLSVDSKRRRFAMMSVLGHLIVWDSSSGQFLLDVKSTDEMPVNRMVAIDSDGRYVAAAAGRGNFATEADYTDGRVFLFDLEDPKAEPRVIEGHSMTVTAIAFDHYGHLFTGSLDGRMRSWNVSNHAVEPEQEYAGSKGPIMTIALDPRGAFVAAGTNGGRFAYLWETQSGALLSGLVPGFADAATASTFDSSGGLIMADKSGKVVRWDLSGLTRQLCERFARPFTAQEIATYEIEVDSACE
jgi:WD40 repeat protein